MKENAAPCLIVDAGNLFFPGRQLNGRVKQSKIKAAERIAQAFIAGTGALVSVGPLDLAAGAGFLKELEQKYAIPLLSANILSSSGEVYFTPFAGQEVGSLNVAVIGLLDHTSIPAGQDDIKVVPWNDVLPGVIEDTAWADVRILLSSYPEETNKIVAEQFNEIHIIVQAGRAARNLRPAIHNNTLFCMTANRGKYQGVLKVKGHASGKWKAIGKPVPGAGKTDGSLQAAPVAGAGFQNRHIPLSSRLPEDRETKILLSK